MGGEWNLTTRFLLCINNHWKYENKQYTIEKPYKIATRNAKKNLNFSKFVGFRAFFEKAVVLENGQIWNQSIFLNETFRRASSLRFNKNGGIVDERYPHLMPATPIFPKHWFFKKGPKNQQILKNSKFFFCISGGNFIGLFNGILFVFILSVVVDTQKETSQLYCCKISIGHHCIVRYSIQFVQPLIPTNVGNMSC